MIIRSSPFLIVKGSLLITQHWDSLGRAESKILVGDVFVEVVKAKNPFELVEPKIWLPSSKLTIMGIFDSGSELRASTTLILACHLG